eukprot:11489601-Alexandrium_andersonii.AAC.1
MSASLVGSEMCIRDRSSSSLAGAPPRHASDASDDSDCRPHFARAANIASRRAASCRTSTGTR